MIALIDATKAGFIMSGGLHNPASLYKSPSLDEPYELSDMSSRSKMTCNTSNLHDKYISAKTFELTGSKPCRKCVNLPVNTSLKIEKSWGPTMQTSIDCQTSYSKAQQEMSQVNVKSAAHIPGSLLVYR